MSVLSLEKRRELLAQSTYGTGAATTSSKSSKSRVSGFRNINPGNLKKTNGRVSLKQLNVVVQQSETEQENPHLTEIRRLENDIKLIKKDPEHYQQTLFFSDVFVKHPNYYDLVFSIPNGGLRGKAERWRIKAEGQKKGMPDVACMYPTESYHGLFIEFKKPFEDFKYISDARAAIAPHQLEKLSLLRKQGYAAFVAYGAKEAMMIFEAYLGLGGDLKSLVLFHQDDLILPQAVAVV